MHGLPIEKGNFPLHMAMFTLQLQRSEGINVSRKKKHIPCCKLTI